MAATFKNASATVSSANKRTDIYTAPGSTQSVIHNLNIANKDTTLNITVDVEVYDSSGTTYVMLGQDIIIPTQSSLVWDKPINLEAGDKIVVSCATAGDAEVFASVLEIT